MMKNKILGMASIAFIAALTAFNVNFTSLENENVDLASLSLISTANAEQGDPAVYGGWGNFWQGKGFYQDEWPKEQPCPIYESGSGYGGANGSGGGYSGGAYGGGSGTQINPSGRNDIRCTNGNSNCSSINC